MSLINNGESDPDRNEMALDARNAGYETEQPVTLGQKLGADFAGGPLASIHRQLQRSEQRRADTYDVANPWLGPQEPELSPEDANEKYAPKAPDGKRVKVFEQPVTDGMAKLIGRQKADEMDRTAVLQRYADQHNPVQNFGAGMIGFLLDPLNAASTFIPGLGEASVLNGMGRVGLATTGLAARTTARTVAGATAGAASQAPLTALTYGLDQGQASDFSMRDAFKSVLYAAAGNAIFHAGFFGAAHEFGILKPDAAMRFAPPGADPRARDILNASASTQHAAMASAIGQMVEGRPVNVDALFASAETRLSPAAVAEKESQLYRDGFAPGLTTQELMTAKDELLPETEPKPVAEPGTEGEVLDKYRQHVTAEAQRLGVPLDDARLTRAAETMAKEHNPDAPQGGPATAFERARGNLLNGITPGEVPSVVTTKGGAIPRAEHLSPADREIETRFAQQVGDHFKKMVYEYSKVPDSQKGVVLNTDAARELSADYLADRTKSTAVHEPASWFIKQLYAEKLKEPAKGDKLPLVEFTAGGTGAGKTTAIHELASIRDIAGHAQIVYDTNMNSLAGAVEKVEMALAAGKDVHITYVYRDPVDALVNGALPRAMKQEGEFGSGRTVPLKDHVATHVGSLKTVKALVEKYKGDQRVAISVFDNSFGAGNQKLIPLDELSNITHDTGIEQKVRQALDEERQKGNISEHVYRGFSEAHPGNAEAAGGLQAADRAGAAAESDQQPAGTAAGHEPELHPDDAAIIELETRLDLTKMTPEEIGALNEAHTNAVAANDLYQARLRDYAACLAANGV